MLVAENQLRFSTYHGDSKSQWIFTNNFIINWVKNVIATFFFKDFIFPPTDNTLYTLSGIVRSMLSSFKALIKVTTAASKEVNAPLWKYGPVTGKFLYRVDVN